MGPKDLYDLIKEEDWSQDLIDKINSATTGQLQYKHRSVCHLPYSLDIRVACNHNCLHLAVALQASEEVVSALIEKGLGVNSVSADRKTPLHYAAECGAEAAVVALLVRKGADMSKKDRDGKTAFDYADGYAHNDEIISILASPLSVQTTTAEALIARELEKQEKREEGLETKRARLEEIEYRIADIKCRDNEERKRLNDAQQKREQARKDVATAEAQVAEANRELRAIQNELSREIKALEKLQGSDSSSEDSDSDDPENGEEANSTLLCKTCYQDRIDRVFDPCGHAICCSRCAGRIHKCPTCRVGITAKKPFFFG